SQSTQKTQALRARYKKQFKTNPLHVTLYAYDSINILADAIRRAGTTNSKAVVRALEKTNYTGVAQKYTFPYTSSRKVTRDVPAAYWHSVANPGFHIVEYTAPKQAIGKVAVLWPAVAQ